MKIIVGLGNPGRKYEATRHNIGFMTVDEIARIKKVSVKETGEGYLSGSSKADGEEVILAKPMTYMNRSGEAVRRLLADYKGNLQDLVVIHDDMDMALGRVRIKTKGGHGGHNGVSSIIDRIGTNRFIRIKIGIGRRAGVDPADFVLGRFDSDELTVVDDTVRRAAEAAFYLVSNDIKNAMNRYNK